VKKGKRSYGCGGSGAIQKFSLFPIKHLPQKAYRAFVFGYIRIITHRQKKGKRCVEKIEKTNKLYIEWSEKKEFYVYFSFLQKNL